MPSRRRRVCVLDAETDPFVFDRVPEPFVWGLDDGREFRLFRKGEEVIEHLRGRNVVVFAHNGGKFDYILLREHLEPHSPVRMINGRLSGFRIGNAIFRDSYLILPTALKNYKKDEIDYRLFEADVREDPEVWAQIVKYLEADCKYTRELVVKFREIYGGGLTLASSGMKFFKSLTGIEIPKTSKAFYRTFKPFYHGGRVSCFRPGIHDLKKLIAIDANSAYPTAMMDYHPWGERYSVWTGMLPDPPEIPRSFITLEAKSTGVFAIETKLGMDFPDDGIKRVFHTTGWEFLAARETGALEDYKIHQAITFHDWITFREYVDHFYTMKKEAVPKSAEYIFAKLFLNSLYGKFAADPERYRNYYVVPIEDVPYIERNEHARYWGYRLENKFSSKLALISKPLEEGEYRYYNVATAASITGYVRAMLWKALKECVRPAYCDTDGIICEGFRGEFGKELGQWKLEESNSGLPWRRLAVAGKKLYALHDGVTPWGKFDKDGAPIGWKLATKGVNPIEFSGPKVFRVAAGEEFKHRKAAPSMSLKSGINFIERRIRRTV